MALSGHQYHDFYFDSRTADKAFAFFNLLYGLLIYLFGLLALTASIISFASCDNTGFNCSGVYRFSRNPMYAAYFIFFIGCAMLLHSWLLLAAVLLFQLAAHQIILAEENWCIQRFGSKYLDYMKKVRRYF